MRLLDSYLLRQFCAPIALLWLVLVAQIWIVQLGDVISEALPYAPELASYLGTGFFLLVPLLTIIFPVAFLGGLAYTLHQLYQQNELAIMLNSQRAPQLLLRAFAIIGLGASAIYALLVVLAAPMAENKVTHRLHEMRQNVPLTNINKAKTFLSPIDGLTIYANERKGDFLYGLVMSDQRARAQSTLWMAQRAVFVRDGAQHQLVLYDGTIQRKSGDNPPSLLRFTQYVENLNRFAKETQPQRRKAQTRSLRELLAPAAEEEYAQSNQDLFRATAHQRLASVLTPLCLALLLLACVLGKGLEPRQWRKQLGIGIAAGAGWLLLEFGIFSLASNFAVALPLLYALPLATLAGLAVYLRGRIV